MGWIGLGGLKQIQKLFRRGFRDVLSTAYGLPLSSQIERTHHL